MSTVAQYKAHVRVYGPDLVAETAAFDRQLTDDEKADVIAFVQNARKKAREIASAAVRERQLRVKAMVS